MNPATMSSAFAWFDGVASSDVARRGDPTSARALATAGEATNARDWRDQRLRDWLLLLLRFAITRERKDEAAALDVAQEMDLLALKPGLAGPSFFRRTTKEVCAAISASNDPERKIVLTQHVARIEDPRLRRTVQAAFDLDQTPPSPSQVDKRRQLWSGLQR